MKAPLYNEILDICQNIANASTNDDDNARNSACADLQKLCATNQNSPKDHPLQWEALADFTDDLALAVTIYEQALVKAEAINSKDFRSSIGFSVAALKVELGDEAGAIEHLEKAKISCNKIVDKELKAEIHDLLEELKGE